MIRAVRQVLRMRQADLAAELRVKRNTVSQYETGDARPSIPVLLRLYNLRLQPELKREIHEHLASDLNRKQPGYPELTDGVIEDWASAEAVMLRFPSTKKRQRAEQLARLAHLLPGIGRKSMLDKSVIDVLDNWFTYGDTETVRLFQDAAEYLRVRIDILAGVDPEEPNHLDLMRQTAKTARRLAIALLRQADAAEQKAGEVRPRKRTRKGGAASAQ